MTDTPGTKTYDGVLGAIPYAYRRTDSRLCRWYVVVGSLLAVGVAVVFALAIVSILGQTAGTRGGFLTSTRTFYVLIALLFVGPLLAPTLAVARRHRHGTSDRRYDTAMAASGFLFVLSLYLGLIASMPPSFRGSTGDSLFAPLIEVFYAIPEAGAPTLPILAVLVMYLVHRHFR
ncbi:MAG: hypothetical protein ACOCQY_02785 [Halorhabdus sp.]